MSEMRKLEDPVRRVVIAGGGNIGVRLALALEQTNQVKIIERDPERARRHFRTTQQGNRACRRRGRRGAIARGKHRQRRRLLRAHQRRRSEYPVRNASQATGCSQSHGVDQPAVICGAGRVGLIDIAISPQQVTIGSLLAHVRRGDVVKVHSLRRGAAEAIEAVAHGDNKESALLVEESKNSTCRKARASSHWFAATQVIMAHHDTVIETDDHVILFMTDRRKIDKIENLFQVDVSFV